MEDRKGNDNTESSSLKKAPSSITVNVRQRMELDGKQAQKRREIPKGLLAGLIALGSLLVVGIIVVGVLLITQPKSTAAVDFVPAAAQTEEPQATPSATPKPTPSATPVPTTAPEESDDDISVIFEAPSNPILDDQTNNQ